MSSTSGTTERSWQSKVALTLIVVIAGWFAYDYLSDYLYPKREAGVEMLKENMGNIVEEHAAQIEEETFQQEDSYRDSNGRINMGLVRAVGSKAAGQVAEDRSIYDETIAQGEGKQQPERHRFMPGSQQTWMPTGIPIYSSCRHIWAKGEIQRDPYTKAGPNGINLADLSPQELKMHLDANGDKTTLLPKIAWGAFVGKVCDAKDTQGTKCGPWLPLGASRFLSSRQAGAEGELWVLPNGYVPTQTEAGLLSRIPIFDTSDFGVYTGGFEFDQDKDSAPDYMCTAGVTVVTN